LNRISRSWDHGVLVENIVDGVEQPLTEVVGEPIKSKGIGTLFSKFATPVAGWLGMECYDPLTGDLKPESKCAQARARLDAAKTPSEFASAIFDRFRSNKPKGDKMADENTEKQYYTLVVLVEAEDAVEALAKKDSGKVLAVNPQQQRPGVQFGGPAQPTQGRVITQGKAQSQSG